MADVLSTNQAFFNKVANEYDKQNAAAIAQLEREIQANLPLIGAKPGSRFLDYACGTGMLSRVLARNVSVSESIGIDATENMAKLYNEQAQNEIASTPRSAYCGNLADPSDPAPAAFADAKFFEFDLAGVGLGWHHFDNCELAAERLVERLKPGGVLFIVDFASHEAHEDGEARRQSGITHNGFSEAQIKAMFEDAGAGGDFAFEELAEPVEITGFGGHGHSHGQHGHGQGHDHHGLGHGHDGGHGHELPRSTYKRKIFIARGTKI